jgi:hypothetical protein
MSSFPGCPGRDQLLRPVSALSGRKEFIQSTAENGKRSGGLSPFRGHGGTLNAPIHMLTRTYAACEIGRAAGNSPAVSSGAPLDHPPQSGQCIHVPWVRSQGRVSAILRTMDKEAVANAEST